VYKSGRKPKVEIKNELRVKSTMKIPICLKASTSLVNRSDPETSTKLFALQIHTTSVTGKNLHNCKRRKKIVSIFVSPFLVLLFM
jgi:hypothetical protein